MSDKFVFDNERFEKSLSIFLNHKDNSLRKLGAKVGLSASTIHRIANDSRDVKMSDFIQLCNAIEVPAIEFFDENEVQMRMFK